VERPAGISAPKQILYLATSENLVEDAVSFFAYENIRALTADEGDDFIEVTWGGNQDDTHCGRHLQSMRGKKNIDELKRNPRAKQHT